MKNKNQLIEIAQLLIPSDAHILRGLLETEEIKVFIFDNEYASLSPTDALIAGGIKINVPSEQKEKAELIVEEFFKNLKKDSEPKCANCNSTHLRHDYKEHFKYVFINLFSALTGVNSSQGVRYYKKCLECGYMN